MIMTRIAEILLDKRDLPQLAQNEDSCNRLTTTCDVFTNSSLRITRAIPARALLNRSVVQEYEPDPRGVSRPVVSCAHLLVFARHADRPPMQSEKDVRANF